MNPAAPFALATQSTEALRFADQLERSFRGGAWHGPSLSEALAGVTADAADRRPIPAAHSIHELVMHLGFWFDEARRRINGEALDDSDPAIDWPNAAETSWDATLARLEESHRQLHATVKALGAERFDQAVAGSDPTLRGMLLGLLQHNAYHGGQIILLALRRGAPIGS